MELKKFRTWGSNLFDKFTAPSLRHLGTRICREIIFRLIFYRIFFYTNNWILQLFLLFFQVYLHNYFFWSFGILLKICRNTAINKQIKKNSAGFQKNQQKWKFYFFKVLLKLVCNNVKKTHTSLNYFSHNIIITWKTLNKNFFICILFVVST